MDFDKICRFCCKSKHRLHLIHTAYDFDSLQRLCSDILRFQISVDDGLPQKLCEMCRSTLTKMQEQIDTFRDNDRMLRLHKCEELTQVDIKANVFGIEEIKEAPTHELQIDFIDAENITQLAEIDQDVDRLAQDETIEEEWIQFESVNQPDTLEEETSFLDKRSDEVSRKNGEVVAQKIPRGRNGGRRRTRFKDPNRPRLNDFKCYICKSDSMGTPEVLLVHLDSHLSELPYTCTDCVLETVVINKVSTLNIHKRMHENPHKCPHCDRRYVDKKAIDTHVQTYHLGESAPCPSPCEQCGKVCSSKSSLKQHMRLHTNGSTCEICGKVFAEKHKLRRHIERKHEKLKKFECHLCHKKLRSLDSVNVHIKTMHSTTKVKCEYCHKSYPSEISLRYHLKKHEQNPNSKFTSDWKQYYTLLDGEEGTAPKNRLKKCNLCGAVLKSISSHMNMVHFPKQYGCDLCNAVFKTETLLEIHVLEHKEGKAYRCPICDREFSEKKNLISHLKTKKHRDHPLAKCLDWLKASSTAVKKNSDSE
ncbi:zinc finger protein 182-like [Topomyia yanbarensis]|uniref:zinc finger protein 182-like n=1 Tax=Topomyia yanbarensis TaxID=2498891 RepID=UPI00273AC670|nr:zinc finger protein 182-like [Topomyia yanbarensis]